eukprot:g23095.t1
MQQMMAKKVNMNKTYEEHEDGLNKYFPRDVERKRWTRTNVVPLQVRTGEFTMKNREVVEKLNSSFVSVFMEEEAENLQQILNNERTRKTEQRIEVHHE